MNDAFLTWIERAKEKNKRWKQDQSRYQLYIQPYFEKTIVSEVTNEMLVKWRSTLLNQKKQRGKGLCQKDLCKKPHRSNFYLLYGSQTCKNPCSDLDHFKPQKRLVFLKSDQLASFFKAVNDDQTPEYPRDFVLLSL